MTVITMAMLSNPSELVLVHLSFNTKIQYATKFLTRAVPRIFCLGGGGGG